MDMSATEQEAQKAYRAYREFIAKGSDIVARNPKLAASFQREKAIIEKMLLQTGTAMQSANSMDAPGDDGLGFLPLIFTAGASMLSLNALRAIGTRALTWIGAAEAASTVADVATGDAGATTGQASTMSNVASIVKWGVVGLALYFGYRIYKGVK